MSISITESTTDSGQPRARISVLWKSSYSDRDVAAARDLIGRVHYQDGKVEGGFVIGFAALNEIKEIAPQFAASAISGDICLVGAGIIKRGMTHGSPTGRRDLAEKCFPEIKLEKLRRDEIVDQMGLALISRVAVEPDLHGYGIGRALANECRRQAVSVVPDSQYVEVMTSQRLNDAQRFLKKENAGRDFLQQLDFDWRLLSPQSPKAKDATTEAAGSTIGRQLSNETQKVDRLFVPLADQPFAWFRSGRKKWELRRFGRQYTPKHVRVGRRVELRRGYKGPDVLWGEIVEVILANGLEDFFSKVYFKEVVPVAETREDAVKIATRILNVDPETPLLGFAVGDL